MKNTSTRLVIYLMLLTFGIALMMLLNPGFLGLPVIAAADYFSSRQQIGGWRYMRLILWISVAILCLFGALHDGLMLNLKGRPLWLWIALAAIWLCGIISEFYWRRKSRSLT